MESGEVSIGRKNFKTKGLELDYEFVVLEDQI